MSGYEAVLRDALALNALERESLIARLAETLTVDECDADALRAEVRKRIASFEAGETAAVPWAIARRSIFAE